MNLPDDYGKEHPASPYHEGQPEVEVETLCEDCDKETVCDALEYCQDDGLCMQCQRDRCVKEARKSSTYGVAHHLLYAPDFGYNVLDNIQFCKERDDWEYITTFQHGRAIDPAFEV